MVDSNLGNLMVDSNESYEEVLIRSKKKQQLRMAEKHID